MDTRTRRTGVLGLPVLGPLVQGMGALLLAGCFMDTQRLPGPLPSAVDPLPPGSADLYPPGPEEVLIIRHADPVQVRPAGRTNSFPMPFYRKQERMSAGTWVFAGAGGRIEVLWQDGTSARFFGTATAIVGSPSRGEASLIVRNLERLSVTLTEGHQVELMGGSVLVSDTGPFVIERVRKDILRVHNASKGLGRIAFREERFDLDPGNVFDLPLLEAGGTPVARPADFQRVDTGSGPVEVRGEVDIERTQGETRFLARGEHELRGLGVRVRLEQGEELWVGELGTDFGAASSAPPPADPPPVDPSTTPDPQQPDPEATDESTPPPANDSGDPPR